MGKLDIQRIDIDKYLKWLFSRKDMEKSVERAKDIDKNSVTWKPFTVEAIESVKHHRKECFQSHLDRFNNMVDGSPLPIVQLSKDEFEGIQEIYHTSFGSIQNKVLRGCIVYDWYKLAEFCGYVDFLKYLVSLSEKEILQNGNIKWTGTKKQLISLFYDLHESGLLKCDKTQIYRLISSNFINDQNRPIKYSYVEKLFKPENIDEREKKKKIDITRLL